MTTKELAKLSGVSVRTLHHYDDIGLLCPKRNVENNYRTYGTEEINKLQQILFFKASGFSLKTIHELLENPTFNALEAFYLQRKSLIYEKNRIESLLSTLDETIKTMEEGKQMDEEKKFKGFEFSENPYEEEARARWGSVAVDESAEKIHSAMEENRDVLKELELHFLSLGKMQKNDPTSDEVQREIAKLYQFFNEAFGAYSKEAFAGVGQLYILDARFTETMQAFGENFPDFIASAMAHFSKS